MATDLADFQGLLEDLLDRHVEEFNATDGTCPAERLARLKGATSRARSRVIAAYQAALKTFPVPAYND
jgi:hypothetical protein